MGEFDGELFIPSRENLSTFLRMIAEDVDKGEHGMIARGLVLLVDTDGKVYRPFLFAHALDSTEVITLLSIAKQITIEDMFNREEEEDDEREEFGDID